MYILTDTAKGIYGNVVFSLIHVSHYSIECTSIDTCKEPEVIIEIEDGNFEFEFFCCDL